MTEYQKYEALIKWLAFDAFAQAPDNTDVWIDRHMKKMYPELNTPSGDWGLHRLLDRGFTEGYISYQDRDREGGGISRWYTVTSKGKDFAQALVDRQKLFNKVIDKYENIDADVIMDMVLYWFALDPKDYKGGMVIPRIRVPAETVGTNIVDYYFKQLNNVDFLINLDLILDQLAIDCFLFKHTDTGWRPTYSITYRGKRFSRDGGYAALNEKEKGRKRTQRLKESLLISGTWFAGVTGVLLVTNELLKNFHWTGTINFWMTFAVFSFGICAGLIIYQIVLGLLKEKE